MLLHFGYVSAIYLFHRDSKKFLGELRDNSFTSNPFPGPVDNIDNALDFTIIQHEVKKDENLRIKHPNGSQSLDVATAQNRAGLPLIIYNHNTGNAQILQLKLLHDNTFVIGYRDFCLLYNDKYRGFQSGSCNDSGLEKSKFDLYYEKSEPARYQVQETHKLPTIPISDGHVDFDDDGLVAIPNDDSMHHYSPHSIEISADLSRGDVTFFADDDNMIKNSGVRIGHSVWKRNKQPKDPYSGLYKHDYVDWENLDKSDSPYYANGARNSKKRVGRASRGGKRADQHRHATKGVRDSGRSSYYDSSDNVSADYEKWMNESSSSNADSYRMHPHHEDCRYPGDKNCKKHHRHGKKHSSGWDDYLRV